MKLIILAGGLGTRLSEETEQKPKPMVEIGGRPILWHIMKIYSQHGINDFIICLGYKGYMIKEYFFNYALHMSDVTLNMEIGKMKVHSNRSESWNVTLVDTGINSMTGGRLRYVRPFLEQETCLLTYGDGLSDVNIRESIKFHKKHKKQCTLTAVQPPGRFGSLVLNDNSEVNLFQEKPQGDGGWINGGFFVLEPEVFELIDNDACVWEQKPLKTLAQKNELMAYQHTGFWQPMDTLRDKKLLDKMWDSDTAPWKTWND